MCNHKYFYYGEIPSNCNFTYRCNRIRYTYLKIYSDKTIRNIATQFNTKPVKTLLCLQVFNMAVPDYAADIRAIL